MDIFSTTTRETWLKFGQKLPSTYLHVFRSLFQPSMNSHFYWWTLLVHDCKYTLTIIFRWHLLDKSRGRSFSSSCGSGAAKCRGRWLFSSSFGCTCKRHKCEPPKCRGHSTSIRKSFNSGGQSLHLATRSAVISLMVHMFKFTRCLSMAIMIHLTANKVVVKRHVVDLLLSWRTVPSELSSGLTGRISCIDGSRAEFRRPFLGSSAP